MLEPNFTDIYPQRDSNVEYDASTQVLIRKRDAARIEINESALLIWQLCDGTQSIDAIINSISSRYNLDRQDAIGTIVPLLQHLHDQQCLDFHQRLPGFKPPELQPLVKYHPIPADLLEMLEDYRRLSEPWFPEATEVDDSNLSEEALEQVMHIPVCRSDDNRVSRDLKLVDVQEMGDLIRSIEKKICKLVPVSCARLPNSGNALYGAGGSMGWHTNEDLPGLRIYCIWTENAGTNYFRYRDPDTGEINTLPEPAGWIVKSFYIPQRPRQVWHCLYAGSRRIALGFAEFEFTKIDQILAV